MGSPEPDKDIEAKLKRLEAAFTYDGPYRWVHFKEYLERRRDNPEFKSRVKLQAGWTEFDYLTDGMMTSELMVVTGAAGNGKTLFCRSLARSFLNQGVAVGYLCYEGAQEDFLQPFEADPHFQLYVPNELEAGNPAWLIEECWRIKAKQDAQVVFIDHLHYVVDMNITQNMSLNVGALLRSLISEVCIKLNMLVVLVAHQQNIDTKKTEPGLETARDSSFIGQEPAIFITVHRQPDQGVLTVGKSYSQGYAMVKIDKARRKGTYRHRLTFRKAGEWLLPFDMVTEDGGLAVL